MANKLPAQTKADRAALAVYDEGAVVVVKSFVASLRHNGETLVGKRTVKIAAGIAKQMWTAGQPGSRFVLNRTTLHFTRDLVPVPVSLVKASAEAVVLESRFKMMDAALRLQQGTLSPADFAVEHNAAIKNLVGAESALARGGFNEMTPTDWTRAEELTARQYGYSRAFHEDIVNGRYGTAGEDMGDAVLQRTGLYSENGRAVYENTVVENARERLAHTHALRLLGAVDHCESCVGWAELGWVPIEEMESEYAIAMSECGPRCHCTIITGVEGDLIDAPEVTRQEVPEQAATTATPSKAARRDRDEMATVTMQEKGTPSKAAAEKIVETPPIIKEEHPQPLSGVDAPQLNEKESNALEDYSGDKFQPVNAYLRAGDSGDKDLDGIVRGIDSALEKLPSMEDVKYRTFGIDNADEFRQFIEKLQPGASYKDEAYMSASDNPRGLQQFGRGRINLEIRGNVGSDISKFSNNPAEREILVPRASEFEVIERRDGQYGEMYFVLQHKG